MLVTKSLKMTFKLIKFQPKYNDRRLSYDKLSDHVFFYAENSWSMLDSFIILF